MENKITIILLLVVGFAGGVIFQNINHEDVEINPIEQYYTAAATTLVSPHHIRKEIDLGHTNFQLVDLRTVAEYEEEHVVGAINIDASLPKAEIVQKFEELEEIGEDIIIYCYSSACLTGRKIGAMLAGEEIYVQEMSIGWNEWRYDFNSWNYPGEWDLLDSSRYVISGSEPGNLPLNTSELPPPCRIDGEFGC